MKPGTSDFDPDFLGSLRSMQMTLDNGKQVTLDVAAELEPPTGVADAQEKAVRCSQRLAFWAYQYERVLARLRVAEANHERLVGMTAIRARNLLERGDSDADFATRFIGDFSVKARVDADKEVHKSKLALVDLRLQLGMLRAVRDAVSNHAFALRRLQDNDPLPFA